MKLLYSSVHVLQGEGDKTVYAVSGLAWGAYTDAEMRKKRWRCLQFELFARMFLGILICILLPNFVQIL